MLDLLRGAAHELLADFSRAGEADLAAKRILQEFLGNFLRRPHHQVDDAGRRSRFDHAFEELNQAQGRLAGRLADDGAAHRQGRRDLARLQRDREIPGTDGPDDADRMLERDVAFARRRMRDDVAVGPFPFLAEPFERVGRMQDLRLGLGDRLALFHGQRAGHAIGPLAHQLGRLLEHLGPVPG